MADTLEDVIDAKYRVMLDRIDLAETKFNEATKLLEAAGTWVKIKQDRSGADDWGKHLGGKRGDSE